mgnify:CR=1 FL=1
MRPPEGGRATKRRPVPYKKGVWNPPVLVHADQAHRETSLAISPRNAAHLLSCAPSGTDTENSTVISANMRNWWRAR